MEKEELRQYVSNMKLDDSSIQKTLEQMKRCEVELQAVEQEFDRVLRERAHLKIYQKLKLRLEKKQQEIYELNRKRHLQAPQRQQLERFDDFEILHGNFQRIQVLKQNIRNLRAQCQDVMTEKKASTQRTQEAEAQLKEANDACNKALSDTSDAAKKTAEAIRCNTKIEHTAAFNGQLEKILTENTSFTDTLRQDISNTEHQLQEVESELQSVQKKLSALQPHAEMLQHGDKFMLQLEDLLYVYRRQTSLLEDISNVQKRQIQRKELLGDVFLEQKKLQDEIATLMGEVEGHHRMTAGQTSYAVQQKALSLHNRKMMLETAVKIWKNIAAGFDNLEEKNQAINELQRKQEYLYQDLEKAKTALQVQEQILEQKHEQWLMTKCQNIVAMRNDLKEGEPCAVCGATSHPLFHKQTAQFSSWKDDYEHQLHEVTELRNTVAKLKQEMGSLASLLELEQNNYKLLEERQQRDVIIWKPFENIDNALAGCTSAIDRNMRALTLQALMESATAAADEAQRELDTYTFHLNAINTTNERINEMRRKETDLSIRLNEESEATMNLQVEMLRSRLDIINKEFTRQYENIQALISIPKWWNEWLISPEDVYVQIQNMMSEWQTATADKNQLTLQKERLSQHLKDLNFAYTSAQHILLLQQRLKQQLEEESETQRSMLAMLTTDGNELSLYVLALENYQEKKAYREYSLENYKNEKHQETDLKANIDQMERQIKMFEAEISEIQTKIDIWMHQYNASHAPVRFEDLCEVLEEGRDWNSIRAEIRQNDDAYMKLQNEVDLLNSQIVNLQIEGIRATDNGEETMLSLDAQQEQLSNQRTQLLQDIARYNILLRNQEQLKKLNIE